MLKDIHGSETIISKEADAYLRSLGFKRGPTHSRSEEGQEGLRHAYEAGPVNTLYLWFGPLTAHYWLEGPSGDTLSHHTEKYQMMPAGKNHIDKTAERLIGSFSDSLTPID